MKRVEILKVMFVNRYVVDKAKNVNSHYKLSSLEEGYLPDPLGHIGVSTNILETTNLKAINVGQDVPTELLIARVKYFVDDTSLKAKNVVLWDNVEGIKDEYFKLKEEVLKSKSALNVEKLKDI